MVADLARPVFFSAVALATLTVSVARSQPPVAPAFLVLGSGEPDIGVPKADGGLLLREVLRQAILIAARDELGLSTRDATLRECAAGPDVLSVRTSVITGDKYVVTLQRGSPDRPEVIWQKEIALLAGSIDYLKLATAAADLAHGELPAALRKAGYKDQPRSELASAQGGKQVEALLGRLTLPDQFEALRRLHAPGPASGEPARLGGLVRAYAQLGQMTAFHWSPAHKAFKARALLYADRLVSARPDSPEAHWHRAYARALVGFPGAALESLAEAERLRAARPADARPEPPDWVEPLDAFCRRDFARLASAARAGRPQAELATLFAYLTLEEEGRNATFVRFARKALESYPDLFRYYDGAVASGQLAVMNVLNTLAPTNLSANLGPRLREWPDLPAAARELAEPGTASDVATVVGPLAQALVQAGQPGRDAAEPSWTVLGRLLQELQFAQAARSANHQRRTLGWSPDSLKDFVREAMPVLADHPLRDFIVSYSVDERRQADVYRGLLEGIPLADLEPTAGNLVTALRSLDTEKKTSGRDAAARMNRHLDATADDLALVLRSRAPAARPAVAREFLAVSPYSPQPVVALIESDWANVADRAAGWERDHAGSPSVLNALGLKYKELKRFDDAERCLKACVRLSPDRPTYSALAVMYKDRGDLARWKETLDDYLKSEDTGLGHAQVQVEIARHFIALKQFDKAKPYADAAAQTAAAWAMLCAAEVDEGLGDYAAAEKWIRETSEHYPTSKHEWLFWCARTGKGDLDEARKLAREWAELVRGTRDRNQLVIASACFLLCEKPGEALEVLQPLFGAANVDRQVGLFAALVADELGKAKERDELLAAVVRRSDAQTSPPAAPPTEAQVKTATMFKGCAELARLFQKALAEPGGPGVDPRQIEAVIADVDPAHRLTVRYLAGRYLELHGRLAEAKALYGQATAVGGRSMSVALSATRLRAMDR